MSEEFRTVPIGEVYESPLNTRRHFDKVALEELTASVREKGVLVPLLVRENAGKAGSLEILAGARRYRAATAAARAELPVRVIAADDDAALEIITIENLQRENLHPLEEAEGYRLLLKRPGTDVAALAAKVGKSESYVYQRLKLTDLIKPAKDAFLADEITAAHAIVLARLQPADQKEALTHCFAERWVQHGTSEKSTRVPVSVRELTSYVDSEILLDLQAAAFKKDDAALLPAAGPCTTCPKRTGFTPALFPDIAKKDTCTDRTCFKAKLAAHLANQQAAIEASGEKVVRLSTSYGGTSKGVLGPNAYEKAGGEKTCASTVQGLVVEGGRDVGKLIPVCTDTKCKVHHPYGGSRYNSPAEQARRSKQAEQARVKAEVSRRSFQALREAAPAKVDRKGLERLVLGYLYEMQNDTVAHLAKTYDVTVPVEKGPYSSTRNYRKHVGKWACALSEKDLTRFLLMLPLARFIAFSPYYKPEGETFEVAAKAWKVNLAKIARAVAAEFKTKAGARKARAKQAKKKPAKARATAAEPACEECGCTENAACEGGCAWDPSFKRKKRWVCTTPACVKAAKRAA